MRLAAVFGLAMATFAIVSCAGGAVEIAGDDVPELVGAIDLEIGAAEGEAPYLFGRVSGVAADRDGRIFVADAQADTVRVFDPDGVFLISIGRGGQGPGEFSRPCCLGFGSDGRLWVRDTGNSRYQAFVVEAVEPAFDGTIHIGHRAAGLWAPLNLDDAGNLIDVGARIDQDSGLSEIIRLHRAPNGDVVSEETIAEPDRSELALHVLERTVGESQVQLFVYQPFGPMHLTAHGPDRWADAVSSRYEVRLSRSDGAQVRIARPQSTEVALSLAERKRAEEAIEQDMQRLGVARGEFPFDVPDSKPPLRALFFDRDRHLWVELSVEDGAARRADVFDQEGVLVSRRVWPAEVRLEWITSDQAFGVTTDDEGVIRVVRLTWSER